ncbi:MAG: hypothetical protein JWN48_2725 [Myxococcaceae bacterium]|nr:hypothetical protein [Myxococcaceae bacterium]
MRVLATRLARALLPSWRFFDEVEPAPKLFFRLMLSAREPAPWQPISFARPRSLRALVLNGAGNLALAEHALLEQLLSDVAEPELRTASAVEQLTSYQLVLGLARAGARARAEAAAGHAHLQFKLTLLDLSTASGAEEEDVLVSSLHEL